MIKYIYDFINYSHNTLLMNRMRTGMLKFGVLGGVKM